MALKNVAKATFPMTLSVVAQGDSHTLNIVCHNRKSSELEAKFNDNATMAELVQFLVESWDLGYDLTEEGLMELEDSWPGALLAVVQGFNDARMVAKAKN